MNNNLSPAYRTVYKGKTLEQWCDTIFSGEVAINAYCSGRARLAAKIMQNLNNIQDVMEDLLLDIPSMAKRDEIKGKIEVINAVKEIIITELQADEKELEELEAER